MTTNLRHALSLLLILWHCQRKQLTAGPRRQ